MNNMEAMKTLEAAFIAIAVYGLFLEIYYKHIMNSNFMDDKFPERACSLLCYIILIPIGGIELFKTNYLFGAIIFIWSAYGIYSEVSYKIPKVIGLDNAKNKKEVIYTGCGRAVWYDEYKDW